MSVIYQFADNTKYTTHLGGVIDICYQDNFIILRTLMESKEHTRYLQYPSKEYAEADIELFYDIWNKYSTKVAEVSEKNIGYQSHAIGEMVEVSGFDDDDEEDMSLIGFGGKRG
jgi:arginine deiminase